MHLWHCVSMPKKEFCTLTRTHGTSIASIRACRSTMMRRLLPCLLAGLAAAGDTSIAGEASGSDSVKHTLVAPSTDVNTVPASRPALMPPVDDRRRLGVDDDDSLLDDADDDDADDDMFSDGSDDDCQPRLQPPLPPPLQPLPLPNVTNLTNCLVPPTQDSITCQDIPSPSVLLPTTAPRALPFFGQLFVHGIEFPLESPVSWVGSEAIRNGAFSRWEVQKAMCLAVNWQDTSNPVVKTINCGSAHETVVFQQSQQGEVTIRPMADSDMCFTAAGPGAALYLMQCSGAAQQEFTYEEYKGGLLSIQAAGHCVVPDWPRVEGQFHVPGSANLITTNYTSGNCTSLVYGILDRYDERAMVLALAPRVVGNRKYSLGETFMGNPGVQLPWDAKAEHLVAYPWAADFCAAPTPLAVDSSAACPEKKFDLTGHEITCDITGGPDGRNCSGFCREVSRQYPCSCGTLSCPGCMLGEGYDAMTDDFLPEGCIYVGCQEDLDLDPATDGTPFMPLLIPGGLNLRTCPNNVIDGIRPWTEVAQPTSSTCVADAEACANEPHTGTLSMSGRNITVCCPGETRDPFSALSLGYFGVMPAQAHYNNVNGSGDGVICDENGCTYRPSCACPLSVPALNIRVTGPSTSLPTIHVPAGEAYRESMNATAGDADIVIAPRLQGSSRFHAYAVAIGSDDSLHIGDNVALNPPGMFKFMESCRASSGCHNRSLCSAVVMDYYPGYGGPKDINPSGAWDVKAPPKSLFDDRRILLTPQVTDGTLSMGPVFIGHPGKTYVGDNPDLRGIFKGVDGRPTTGPGSAPGGSTNDGSEKLKAFFQCKDDITSGTEFDKRIWY